jgi:tetratricopeptide (TPR) repeat protein
VARASFDLGDFAGAEPDFREAVTRADEGYPRHWFTGACHMLLGRCYEKLDRLPEAEAELLRAHEILVAALGPANERTRQAAEGLAALYERDGKPEQAAEWRAAASAPEPPAAPGE